MSPDARSIRDAWTRIPSPGTVDPGNERFTAKRIERIIRVIIALGSAVIGAQALFAAAQWLRLSDTVHAALLVLVFFTLVCMLVACVVGRRVRVTAAAFAFVYVGALVAWPFIAGPRPAGEPTWIFFLADVAVAAAMLAFSQPVQYGWAVGVPLVYGVVRLLHGGFTPEFWRVTAFDVSFMLVLGLIIVSLGWMFRSVAAGVDDARTRAVADYTAASAAAAAEEERVAVSALMHDSVLAALIAAERAETPRERELAVAMAREALTRLANTEASALDEGNDDPTGADQVAVELRRVLSELGVDAVVEERGEKAMLPGRVARAVVLAARQAIGNAVVHAHAQGIHVVVAAQSGGGILVAVSDAGAGFDLDGVDDDRLGIRASILARMAAVGGSADISSGPSGTRVELRWESR